MRADQLRQKYIEFFQSKGHLHQAGAPLVPIDALGVEDRSTLFTSAGMQQFKAYFAGEATPPSSRICTVQKCLRTGDIDSVGDYSHCTFFEMLGNFSFGDYFKQEVITWTWEFLIDVLGIDADRLCVTIYKDDDEAFSIWHDQVGLPADRIHRLDEDKNFWPASVISQGPNGLCGPCSEIFYRVAPLEEMTQDPNLTPTERYLIDDDAGRWLEIWNNVFTQFDRSEDASGKAVLTTLPRKNNDTGAGLDRIVRVLQNRDSVFETDLFAPALARIAELSGLKYGGTMSPADFAFRCVAEHTRSMVFCIADGILPSNEGRGYVLRYIIRRAVRYGKMQLGFDTPFLHEVAPAIIQQMGSFYTELVERQELILKTILAEEERFRTTLDHGLNRLLELLDSPEVQKSKQLPGGEGGAFTLYDTFGFPIKLTEELAAERGVTVDMAAFDSAMQEQRERSQLAGGEKKVFGDAGSVLAEVQHKFPTTEFVGYDQLSCEAKVLAIIKDGQLADSHSAGPESVEVILDRTPFYANSGGQVGDTGTLRFSESHETFQVRVNDTRKVGGYFIHSVNVDDDVLRVGQQVFAEVDLERRQDIMRNHTATHLLQAAMRNILGTHVHQKGSLVEANRLRFDFTHGQPVTAEELRQIELAVNREALRDDPVIIHKDVPIAEAKARGAMALFGEKYGDNVRVVEVPGCSIELCGGTHLNHTSQVGLFKIVNETGVAAGVRRIEAVTGNAAYTHLLHEEETLQQAASLLKTQPGNLITAIEKLQAQRTELERQKEQLVVDVVTARSGGNGSSGDVQTHTIHGIPVLIEQPKGLDGKMLSSMADRLAEQNPEAVVVLGSHNDGSVSFAVKVPKQHVAKGVHAGKLIKEIAAIAGGGGGGRPDFAQAGGRNPEKLDEAISTATLERLLSNLKR